MVLLLFILLNNKTYIYISSYLILKIRVCR
jgi:hypothetical protein